MPADATKPVDLDKIIAEEKEWQNQLAKKKEQEARQKEDQQQKQDSATTAEEPSVPLEKRVSEIEKDLTDFSDEIKKSMAGQIGGVMEEVNKTREEISKTREEILTEIHRLFDSLKQSTS